MPRILLDQNVPKALRTLPTGRDIRTAADQGSGEMSNGDLLRAGELAGFAVMVTADQNIVYQQNMAGRRIGLIFLSTNHWQTIRADADRIQSAVRTVTAGGYAYVDCVQGAVGPAKP